jgi:hypothetical protein
VINLNPKDYKILFYSEDGYSFRLFVDGKEISSTRGITINASGEEITLSANIVMSPIKVIEDGQPIIKIDGE